jgi:hypothetical protein
MGVPGALGWGLGATPPVHVVDKTRNLTPADRCSLGSSVEYKQQQQRQLERQPEQSDAQQ